MATRSTSRDLHLLVEEEQHHCRLHAEGQNFLGTETIAVGFIQPNAAYTQYMALFYLHVFAACIYHKCC